MGYEFHFWRVNCSIWNRPECSRRINSFESLVYDYYYGCLMEKRCSQWEKVKGFVDTCANEFWMWLGVVRVYTVAGRAYGNRFGPHRNYVRRATSIAAAPWPFQRDWIMDAFSRCELALNRDNGIAVSIRCSLSCCRFSRFAFLFSRVTHVRPRAWQPPFCANWFIRFLCFAFGRVQSWGS